MAVALRAMFHPMEMHMSTTSSSRLTPPSQALAESLSRWPEGTKVTIQVPVEGRTTALDKLQLELRAAAEACQRALEMDGLDADIPVLDELMDSSDKLELSLGGVKTLLVFATKDGSTWVGLPESHPALHRVGRTFYVRSLATWIQGMRSYYLLVLDASDVALYRNDATGFERVNVKDMPTSIEEALWSDDPEESLQFRTQPSAGSDRAMFHGQGAGNDEAKVRHERFFRKVDAAIAPVIRQDVAPLVLACVEYYAPIYEEVNSSGEEILGVIPGSPANTDIDELRTQARTLVTERSPGLEKRALDSARALQAKEPRSTCSEPASLIELAEQGGIDTLLVTSTSAVSADQAAPSGGDDIPGPQDLVDLTVHRAAATGARIVVLPDGELPDEAAMLGLLRWPMPKQ